MAEIQVNGRTYRLVGFDEYTLNEAMVFFEYTKMSQAEIVDIDGFNPAVVAAMIHIAVARGEPGETERSIRAAVGAIPVAKLNEVFMEVSVEVPDELPLPDATRNGSGDGSSTSSELPLALSPPQASGSPGSATGAAYDRQTWAT